MAEAASKSSIETKKLRCASLSGKPTSLMGKSAISGVDKDISEQKRKWAVTAGTLKT
jgi:hypothetical protein